MAVIKNLLPKIALTTKIKRFYRKFLNVNIWIEHQCQRFFAKSLENKVHLINLSTNTTLRIPPLMN